MSNQAIPLMSPARKARRWPWILLAILAMCALLSAAGIFSMLRLSSHARAVRDVLLTSAGNGSHKNFEVSAGWFTTSLVRSIASWTSLDARVKTALKSVRSVEVGVYSLKGRAGMDGEESLSKAEMVMEQRGWSAVVKVLDGRELVLVYTREEQDNPRNVQFCVVAQEDRRLVIVSARGNLQPLWTLARTDPESPLKRLAPQLASLPD